MNEVAVKFLEEQIRMLGYDIDMKEEWLAEAEKNVKSHRASIAAFRDEQDELSLAIQSLKSVQS